MTCKHSLMRTYTFALIMLIFTAACNEKEVARGKNTELLPASLVQNPSTAGETSPEILEQMPVIIFTDTVHNFGNVYEGEEVMHGFTFTNTGKKPLLISGVTTSCGCTVADYPQEPMLPGEDGTLKVKFKSTGQTGYEEKSVSIQTNTARGTHLVYIKANIISRQ